ncbi:iron-sulfur binding electron transfer protein [Aerosticca soli]|uniref:Iron-sulfur binding electron transfer protein n=2 Tax=Aerosticca soli TaxID=2010829 RepID=A0A2Z6E3D4_9GAMM|nr:iron-sulfur binding electron transfer protein [Aerosticca soli]
MPAQDGARLHRITLRETGESYACAGDRSLLKAMVALGRRGIPSGCHGGGCGVCKIRVLEGSVRCEAMSRSHVSVEEQATGYALACRAYPLSDVVLEVVGGMRKGLTRRYGLL